ncbi:glycosyltransferase [Nakamurella flava]|uniref:4,4'-diaponeurosporenoate glycosyltransferase n=1 Tax=Nakamurella flava TaxID=2576308 RepID=A0A4U6QDK7_9ACTN|nr:glycosyltransferase [Nakamurella flava]TKV58277.1 glycosyltransferase [Nakamurella flava]
MTVVRPLGTPRGGCASVDAVAVVIPARDEEATITACLEAVMVSAAAVAVPVSVIVVADRCTDATAERAAAFTPVSPGRSVTVVASRAGQVGAARDEGVRSALRCAVAGGAEPRRVWIACTDADSRVPSDWLAVHVEIADSGADLVLGTVRPDPADLPSALLESWWRRHLLTDGHPHVHGANLGVRGDRYETVGGFPHLPTHEDVRLADAVRRSGGRVVATGRAPVLTSGRRVGRAPAGLSSYLRELVDLDPSA